ncbi:MAG: EMC3/TMCO1 family protein [Candidatus Woesearchaeota archaeon]
MDPFSEFIFNLHPLISIAIIAFSVTLFTSLVYRFVTDQKVMKTLKGELKDLQKMMKEHRDKPEKLMRIQKEAMEKNMQYMRHSMKPTLFTMLPLILMFGWLNAHIAYEPIQPGESFEVWVEMQSDAQGLVELEVYPDSPDFSFETPREQEIVDGEVRWELNGPPGEYELRYHYEDETEEQELLITDDPEYKTPTVPGSGSFKELNVGNEKVAPLSFLGLEWGWIWSYILLSVGFSMIIRKLLKVH